MRMKLRVAALLVAAAAAAPAFADSDLPQIGGRGGAQYRERCPEGQVLNGFELRAGDDIDAIHAVCVTAISSTQTSGPPLTDGFGGGWHGGSGGGLQRLLCPPETPVVTGVSVGYDGFDTISLDAIDIYCGPVATKQEPKAYASNHFHAPVQGCHHYFLLTDCAFLMTDGQDCPAGEIAIGMHGHSGNLVDAMGLICGPAPTFGSPPSPPAPAMGHVGPKKTQLQRTLENTSVERQEHTTTANATVRAGLRPRDQHPHFQVAPASAANAAARSRAAQVTPKPESKPRPTLRDILEGDDDDDD